MPYKNKKQKREYDRKWRERNREKCRKYEREYMRKHRKKSWINRQKQSQYHKKWEKNNPEKVRENQRKKYWNNPHKCKIRRKARHHIPIPNNQLCEYCKKRKATDRHHKDYNKPYEVDFLCNKCHLEIHSQEKICRIK